MKHEEPLGRPTLLTPELQTAICRDLALGVSKKTAALCNGISPRTLRRWLAAGRSGGEGGEGEESLLSLLSAVKKAEQDAIRRNIGIIQKVAAGGFVAERRTINRADGTEEVIEKFAAPEWCASAWTAERLDPERFGQNRRELVEMRKNAATLGMRIEELERRLHDAERLPPPTPPASPAGG